MLRQLADEIESEETRQEMKWITEQRIIDDKIADVNIRAHNNEAKLRKIGHILMED